MRRTRWYRIAVFSLFCVVGLIDAGMAEADTVIYTLTGTTNPAFGPVHAESFQFTTSSFVTSYTSLSVSQLDSCVACSDSGTTVEFYPNGTLDTVVPVDEIRFSDANGIVYGFFFAPGDLSEPGTYTASDFPPNITSNTGTLTVQGVPEIDPMNAMAPFALLAGAVFIIRGRRKTPTQPESGC